MLPHCLLAALSGGKCNKRMMKNAVTLYAKCLSRVDEITLFKKFSSLFCLAVFNCLLQLASTSPSKIFTFHSIMNPFAQVMNLFYYYFYFYFEVVSKFTENQYRFPFENVKKIFVALLRLKFSILQI